MFVELLFMFQPMIGVGGQHSTVIEAMTAQGTPRINTNVPILNQSVNFYLSSTVPEGMVMGFTKAETLEELVEAGSSIAENDRSILNQSITYLRSENTGYKLVFGDTRQLLDTTQYSFRVEASKSPPSGRAFFIHHEI
jgi:hypothetical protein